jgi:hypothetical protein
MKIFTPPTEDEEELYIVKQSFTTHVCIEPSTTPLKRSGGTTTPLDGVSVVLIDTEIF